MNTIRKLLIGFFLLMLIASAAKAAPCEILLNRFHRGESELMMRLDGEKAGVLRYRMVAPEEAVITGMFIEDFAKGRKLSTALVHAMFLRNPEIKKVGALLVLTNLSASGLVWVKHKITDEACAAAVLKTPFVKTFKHFGFNVSSCYFDPVISFLEVEVSR